MANNERCSFRGWVAGQRWRQRSEAPQLLVLLLLLLLQCALRLLLLYILGLLSCGGVIGQSGATFYRSHLHNLSCTRINKQTQRPRAQGEMLKTGQPVNKAAAAPMGSAGHCTSRACELFSITDPNSSRQACSNACQRLHQQIDHRPGDCGKQSLCHMHAGSVFLATAASEVKCHPPHSAVQSDRSLHHV